MPVGGVVYILEQTTGSQERHISSIHTSTPIFEFGNEFDKTLKNQCFLHFNIVKNHQKHLQNTSKPLQNKASIELT